MKAANENFLSGENIAELLGISRTAVWKHIQKLREQGYEITSSEHLGYKLQGIPDLLLPNEIQSGLDTNIIGKNIFYETSVDSTNRIAKVMAHDGATEGTLIIAEEQTGGKGRLDRKFFSPRSKGIWCSIILRPNYLPKDAPKFTLMTAVAISEAMNRFNLKPAIKWPNDILFDGRKIVGILTEMTGEIERIAHLIIGIGINVNIDRNEFPPEIKNIAASLSEMSGKFISRVKFLRVMLEKFDKIYSNVRESGFDETFRLWKKYNITLGKNIKVISANNEENFFGKAVDLNEDGALIIETLHGQRVVYAGDVSIR